jgi:hypothetical protein
LEKLVGPIAWIRAKVFPRGCQAHRDNDGAVRVQGFKRPRGIKGNY